MSGHGFRLPVITSATDPGAKQTTTQSVQPPLCRNKTEDYNTSYQKNEMSTEHNAPPASTLISVKLEGEPGGALSNLYQ